MRDRLLGLFFLFVVFPCLAGLLAMCWGGRFRDGAFAFIAIRLAAIAFKGSKIEDRHD